jgi:predicted lipoprotein with Yx(FWY)xxD motif
MQRSAILITSALLVGLGALAGPSPAATTGATVIKTAHNAQLGREILVDGRGRTLYLLLSDTGGVPTCAALSPACPKAWPAVPAKGRPVAGRGIVAGLLGVAIGAGGVRQVTYNHHPLYYFRGGFGAPAGDRRPGQIRGQAFYGIWFVLSARGRAITH